MPPQAIPSAVIVHPLVLLSVVDHYNRVARDTKKRVVGVLLGEVSKGKVDVTNSFALPFDEEDKDSAIWFVDHDYLENMYAMYKKVNAREIVVGWYSSGPKIKQADILVNEVFKKYTPLPVLVVVDVHPKDLGIPTEAYVAIEQVKEDGTPIESTFAHIPSEIGAYEAEEIGVEHLLRDIKDINISTLATEVQAKLASLKGLQAKLKEVHSYLDSVSKGKLPLNHELMSQIQDVLNLLPNINNDELLRSFAVQTNDMMLVIYISSLIRSILAIHDLINNKFVNKERERQLEAGPAEKKEKDSIEKEKVEKSAVEKPAAGS
eukprot:CAMPEP_0184655850 /NCGR_PEP_ID=MMETSP0308-20130426/14634_1 /TAXON_ID=38269 /ORGANISM="Gloeochaete witrockiana, Strain SAG 46.84" /LENGTH=319 /DNA_ID=CAMNT_0027092633 /DNA_START=14 /DNA_END=976 /DNA_ORIENTATION=+